MTGMYIVLSVDIPVDRRHGLYAGRYMNVHRGSVNGSVYVIGDIGSQVELHRGEFREVNKKYLTEEELTAAQCTCGGKYDLWTVVRGKKQ